jgi:hypothetical protein
VEDVLKEINLLPAPACPAARRVSASVPEQPDLSDFAGYADPLLAALGYDPVTLDALCERSGQPPEAAAARLLGLGLAGPPSVYRETCSGGLGEPQRNTDTIAGSPRVAGASCFRCHDRLLSRT